MTTPALPTRPTPRRNAGSAGVCDPATGTFSAMTDTATDIAQARAALASHAAPEMRVLRAVHNGLVALPDHRPARPGRSDDEDARAAG